MIIKIVHCPYCNSKFEVLIGKKTSYSTLIKCKKCRHNFTLKSRKIRRYLEFLKNSG